MKKCLGAGALVILLAAVAACTAVRTEDRATGLRKGDRVLFCGDSITDMAYSRSSGYYHTFTNALGRLHPELGVRVADIGLSGWTVGMFSKGLDDAVAGKRSITFGPWNMADELTNHQDVVTLFLGMNDILRPTVRDDDATLDAWAADLRALVRKIKAGTTPRLMVLCTITPLTTSPDSPKNLVRARMNARARKIAAAEGCRVAETGAAVEDLIEKARALKQDYQPTPDFVHPDAPGHLALGLALTRAIKDDTLAADYQARYTAAVRALKPSVPFITSRVRLNRKAAGHRLACQIDFATATPDGSLPENVSLLAPGWSVVQQKNRTMTNTLFHSGEYAAEHIDADLPLETKMHLTAIYVGKEVTRDFIIAAPWLVVTAGDRPATWDTSVPYVWGKPVRWIPDAPAPAIETDLVAGRGFGNGKLFTPTIDYHGQENPNAVDAYGVTFGWQNDALYAARWVKSEKERDVVIKLSHQTFSATLGLRVWVNGEKVGDADLNRFGKNTAELKAHLKAGWNRLLVRCDHMEWQWEFACALAPVPGDNLDALRYAWMPPTK